VEGLGDHSHLAASVADWFAGVAGFELRQILFGFVKGDGETA
jgi:hypothetical protein